MPKLQLLILDACIVIKLHEIGLWEKVVEKCDVHLSSIVANVESQFHHAEDEDYAQDIELQPLIESGQITVFEVSPSDIQKFAKQFDANYFEALDDGEAESLAHLFKESKEYLVSSSDAIVFRVLGNTARTEQGISLEEILQKIGLSRELTSQYSKDFREKYSKQGSQDMIQGRGKTTE